MNAGVDTLVLTEQLAGISLGVDISATVHSLTLTERNAGINSVPGWPHIISGVGGAGKVLGVEASNIGAVNSVT